MKRSEQQFISILRNFVHWEDSFTIENPDWNGILTVSKKQNLFPLIFDAAVGLPGYEEMEAQYFESVVAQVSAQARKTSEFLQLYRSFWEDGFSPIVLKGIICRNLYGERADFRSSGDEDILVAKEEYDRVVKTLNRCGYRTSDEPDSRFEAVQEVTFLNPETSLTIELHLNPFGSVDSIRTGMNKWFEQVFDSQETVIIDGVPLRTLPPTDHLLFLIFHAFKHFIYGGFGIRQMLDILLFSEKYDSRIDWDYIRCGLEDVGADRFYSDLVFIGNRYLGFELPLRGQISSPDELLEDMFRAGTFGNSTTADHVAALFISEAVQRSTAGKKKEKRKPKKWLSMTQRLFPSWQSWTARCPYLKDRPWMLPVEWAKRLVRYLRGNADMGSITDINESYAIAERRLELLEKYNII